MARNSSGSFFNRFLDFIGLVDDDKDGQLNGALQNGDSSRVYNPTSRRNEPEARPVRSTQQDRFSPSGRQESNSRVKPYDDVRGASDRNASRPTGSFNPYDYEPQSDRNYGAYSSARNNENARTQSGANRDLPRDEFDSRQRGQNQQRDEFSDYRKNARPGQNPPARQRNNVVDFRSDGRHQTVIYYLHTLEECRNVINDLLEYKSVLLNLEDMDVRETQRSIDMLSGAAFALDAKLRKASDKTYLIAPNNVEVAMPNDVERRY